MEAFPLELHLHFVVICLYTSAYLKHFNIHAHCCALHCALLYSLAAWWVSKEVQQTPCLAWQAVSCKLLLWTSYSFLVCDIKYILLMFSDMKTCMSTSIGHTATRNGKELALERIVLGKSPLFASISISLSHQTCKQAVITLQMPICWLSPHLSLCLFIHFLSHLTLFCL